MGLPDDEAKVLHNKEIRKLLAKSYFYEEAPSALWNNGIFGYNDMKQIKNEIRTDEKLALLTHFMELNLESIQQLITMIEEDFEKPEQYKELTAELRKHCPKTEQILNLPDVPDGAMAAGSKIDEQRKKLAEAD